MSNTNFDLFCHCTNCGCRIQYPDSWDSDYGVFCHDCAENEALDIVARFTNLPDLDKHQEDSELC